MEKLLPSDYYNSKEGIFITEKIRFTFGRRQAYVIQFLLDKFEQAIKENKLLHGFVFIPNNELQKKTGYHCNSERMKNIIRYYKEKEKWRFLEIETFGAEDGKFYKIDLNILFNKIVPEFEENYKKSLLKSKFGETINGK